jgi:hypothetical protein
MTTIELTKERTPFIFEVEPVPGVLEQVAAAEQYVKAALQYDYDGTSKIDDLAAGTAARCTGHTIVGSQKLEETGVRHYVAMVNGHATIIVPTEDDLWLSDMTSPRLSQSVRDNLLFYGSSHPNRSIARIDTTMLIAASGLDRAEAEKKIPWLRLDPTVYRSKEFTTSEEMLRGYNMIISLFQPEQGRESIYLFKKFNEAYEESDFAGAGQNLIAMDGQCPEADIRSEFFKHAKSTIRRLAAAKRFDEAEAARRSIFDAMTFSSDSRVKEYNADCLRYIAAHSGELGMAAKAIELYRSAREHPNAFKSSISAKIDLCSNLTKEGK